MANSPVLNGIQPIAVSKVQAAAMLNISPSKFAELVLDGSMPSARCVGSRRIWIVSELYSCAACLPLLDEEDTWADVK